MVAVTPILSLLVVFAVSLLLVRIGAVALRMTGLSPEVSSFQAVSAFSGAGYTTEEAERTVSTPGRRTTVKALIRLGNLGLVSAMATLVLSFTRSGGDDLRSLVYIVGGVLLLVGLARSAWLNRFATPIIERALNRVTDLQLRDYTRLLGLQEDYRVAEVDVGTDGWFAGERLTDLDLAAEGVLVLGIQRDGAYIGAPGPDTRIDPEDTVVLYGKEDRLRELSERRTDDDEAHEDAVAEHEPVHPSH